MKEAEGEEAADTAAVTPADEVQAGHLQVAVPVPQAMALKRGPSGFLGAGGNPSEVSGPGLLRSSGTSRKPWLGSQGTPPPASGPGASLPPPL
jgi:hypothetical protein